MDNIFLKNTNSISKQLGVDIELDEVLQNKPAKHVYKVRIDKITYVLKLIFFEFSGNKTARIEVPLLKMLSNTGYGSLKVVAHGATDTFAYIILNYLPYESAHQYIYGSKKPSVGFELLRTQILTEILKEVKKISNIGNTIGLQTLKEKYNIPNKSTQGNLCLTHGDFHNLGNVMWDNKRKVVPQLIDFECLTINEIEYDLAWIYRLFFNDDLKEFSFYLSLVELSGIHYNTERIQYFYNNEDE